GVYFLEDCGKGFFQRCLGETDSVDGVSQPQIDVGHVVFLDCRAATRLAVLFISAASSAPKTLSAAPCLDFMAADRNIVPDFPRVPNSANTACGAFAATRTLACVSPPAALFAARAAAAASA